MPARGDLVVQTIVVDNGSGDGSAEMVAAEFPTVILQRNSDNVGFARGNNQAARGAGAPLLLLLNNDTLVRRWRDANTRSIHGRTPGCRRRGTQTCRRRWQTPTFRPKPSDRRGPSQFDPVPEMDRHLSLRVSPISARRIRPGKAGTDRPTGRGGPDRPPRGVRAMRRIRRILRLRRGGCGPLPPADRIRNDLLCSAKPRSNILAGSAHGPIAGSCIAITNAAGRDISRKHHGRPAALLYKILVTLDMPIRLIEPVHSIHHPAAGGSPREIGPHTGSPQEPRPNSLRPVCRRSGNLNRQDAENAKMDRGEEMHFATDENQIHTDHSVSFVIAPLAFSRLGDANQF